MAVFRPPTAIRTPRLSNGWTKRSIRRKAKPKRRFPPEVLTDMEVRALMAACSSRSASGIRNRALIALLYRSGLRLSEALDLYPKDVDFDRGAIRVLNGKGGKSRVIPFGPRLENRLRLWFSREDLKPSDYLWPIRPGGYYLQRSSTMGNTSFQKWYGDCLAAADVEYRNPHVTRHTFATRWLRRGGRLETLSRVMGHSSIKTTHDLYAHLDTSDVLRDLQVIEGGK